MEEGWQPLQIGRAEQLTDGDALLIVAYGSMVAPAMATAGLLQEKGVRASVVNARFVRPLDESLLLPLARRIQRIVTMEEGALAGGFGGAVVEALSDQGIQASVLRIGIPDVLVDHATPEQSKESLGLTPPQMAERILSHFAAELVPFNDDSLQNAAEPLLRR
jgi:1-deoxy-D-xylulose-5-phosphate synthase